MMKTLKDINYHTPYPQLQPVIPAGTEVIPATNLPGTSKIKFWACAWDGMTEAEESWLRNYGFGLSNEDMGIEDKTTDTYDRINCVLFEQYQDSEVIFGEMIASTTIQELIDIDEELKDVTVEDIFRAVASCYNEIEEDVCFRVNFDEGTMINIESGNDILRVHDSDVTDRLLENILALDQGTIQ
jgi:hypothetical protein